MKDDAKIYKEVLLAIENAPSSQVSVIPEEVIDNLRKISDSCTEDVKLKYDVTGEVVLSEEAKAMLVMIYQKFFLPERERAVFLKKLIDNDSKK